MLGDFSRSAGITRRMLVFRWWCPGTESNCRHEDFQSSALPTELPGQRLNLKPEWCPGTESNCRHEDFQSSALPTELPGRQEPRIKLGYKQLVKENTVIAG